MPVKRFAFSLSGTKKRQLPRTLSASLAVFDQNILTIFLENIIIKGKEIIMFNIIEYENKINNFYEIISKNEDIVNIKLSDEKWTLKEMIGHLIDSASNNHQRIIRLQIDKIIYFPAYEAEDWKNITKINEHNINGLKILWKEFNYYILHLIKNISEENLSNIWEINGKELTLKFIIEDYFGRHLDWHIELYKKRIEEIIENKNSQTST